MFHVPRRTPATTRVPALVSALLCVLALLASGCAYQIDPSEVATPSSDESSTPTASATPVVGRVDKLLVFVVENHSMEQMRDQMPWLDGLAQSYGSTTRYRALTHPSLPNYLAIAGGSTFGITDDAPPTEHPLSGASVFGRAIATGATATVYAEDMPSACYTADSGEYAVKHNPWAYFADEQETCLTHDVPLAALAGDVKSGQLPAVGMVIPNLCNDAHNCPLAQADTWLSEQVGEVMAGRDWASGRLAIVITADEDETQGAGDNRVLTVVAHPRLKGVEVDARLTHYSLSRAYAEVAGFAPLRKARRATSLLAPFGLAAGG
ncbi:phosphoesterase [Nocardioides sp. GY 10113]|uniref:alkaline phosphatase family protein n=1 Tax=Nocardioides sp. GY 10113 TaxID=2569761 RepID=UPI0010A776E4|nr:alkaline phosphatase family protein [Nocardioides sp. GY 10113]TIC81327.1 phosphoesterase [Nocardioides sp. GY 10113]